MCMFDARELVWSGLGWAVTNHLKVIYLLLIFICSQTESLLHFSTFFLFAAIILLIVHKYKKFISEVPCLHVDSLFTISNIVFGGTTI